MKTFKRHFRFNRFTGHPAYIVNENENYFMYITLTHSPRTFGKRNLRLSNGSYVIPVINILEKKMFTKPANNIKLTRSDGPVFRNIYRTNKW